MADWDGILIVDPRGADQYALIPVSEIVIETDDAEQYAESYTPQEGCTEPTTSNG